MSDILKRIYQIVNEGSECEREELDEIKEAEPKVRYFAGVKGVLKPPTKNHIPAIWETILGYLMAYNGIEAKDFEDYDEAKEYAQIANKKDIRIYRYKRGFSLPGMGSYGERAPKHGQIVVGVEK